LFRVGVSGVHVVCCAPFGAARVRLTDTLTANLIL
jgi:hypothetical protein